MTVAEYIYRQTGIDIKPESQKKPEPKTWMQPYEQIHRESDAIRRAALSQTPESDDDDPGIVLVKRMIASRPAKRLSCKNGTNNPPEPK